MVVLQTTALPLGYGSQGPGYVPNVRVSINARRPVTIARRHKGLRAIRAGGPAVSSVRRRTKKRLGVRPDIRLPDRTGGVIPTVSRGAPHEGASTAAPGQYPRAWALPRHQKAA